MRRAARAGSIISQLFEARGMERKLREYRAWEVWEQVVGAQIASHARPLRLRDGVLEVRVDQPIWMQQLRLMAPQILAKLNQALGEELVKEIFWRRGTLAPAESIPKTSPPFKLPPLTDEETKSAEKAVTDLADPELRQALGKLIKRQLQADKKRREDPDQD
jgi:hypothetical protein